MKKRMLSLFLALIFTFQYGFTAFADTETPYVPLSDVDIYGVSLVLSGEIGLTFHVKVKKQYWGGIMELKFENKEDVVPIILNFKDCPSEGLGLYTATYYLSAIELSEPVMLTVFDADGGVLVQKSCSAEEYVGLLKQDEKATEEEKNVGITLINYGHYAQLACSKANGWEIGEDYKETGEYYKPTVGTSAFNGYKIKWQKHSATPCHFSMSLRLDYKTGIHLYFPFAEKPTVTVNGEAVEVVKSERLENNYEIFIDGINALNLENEYEITVNDVTFNLSAFSYCNLAVKRNTSQNTIDAMRALYEFYRATVYYQSSKGV